MTEKSEDITKISPEEALAVARAWATPENMARLDVMTEEDVARQIADNPDAASELTDTSFANARLVIPIRSRRDTA